MISQSFASSFLSSFARIAATVEIELKLFIRDTLLPGLIAILLGLCYFLTPSEHAAYAIITMNDQKPLMNADTALVAGSLVFSIMVFPLYLLLMGVGRVRDNDLGVNTLVIENRSLLLLAVVGRIVANNIKVLLLSVVVLLALILMAFMQFNQLSGATAVLFFFATVLPVSVMAIAGGVLLDYLLPGRRNTQLTLVFFLWMTTVVMGMLNGFDFYGMELVHSTPDQGSLSIGFIAASGMATFVWSEFASARQLINHFLLYTGVGLLVLHLSALLTLSKIQPSNKKVASSKSTRAPLDLSNAKLWQTRASHKKHTNVVQTLRLLFGLWFRLSTSCKLMYPCLLVACFIRPQDIEFILPVALVIPCLLFKGQNMLRKEATAALEHTTVSLLRPTAMLTQTMAFNLFILLPVIPALIYFDGWRLASLLLSTGLSVWWMFWTHHKIDRPLLGVGLYVVFWYVFAVNKPPVTLDFFGIHAGVSHSLSVTLLTLVLVGVVVTQNIGFNPKGKKVK